MKPFIVTEAIMNLGDFKRWIEECEKEHGCDASKIAVCPEAGGDWDHFGDGSDDSVFCWDGTITLATEKCK